VKTDTVEADAVIMDGFSAEDEKKVAESKESFQFQAEVNRLMEILINSLCKFFFY
jgi:HSP90 family molecular chaperone